MDEIWISSSFFIEKQDTTLFFRNFLIPFLKNNQVGDQTNSNQFIIKLNGIHGNNIRFSLLKKLLEGTVTAKHLRDEFRTFLFESQLQEKKSSKLWDGIFLEYPINTLQFGLYEPKPACLDYPYLTEQVLSKVIVDVLEYENYDSETLTSLLWYLYMCAVKEIKDSFPSRFQVIKQEIAKNYKTNSLQKKAFLNNRHLFHEISDDILNPIVSNDFPKWLILWKVHCKVKFNRFFSESIDIHFFDKLMQEIYDQYGIDHNISSLMNSMMNQYLVGVD